MTRKIYYTLLFLAINILFINILHSNPVKSERYIAEPITLDEKKWVDSVMETLTLREKIAQLFMIDVYTSLGQKSLDRAINLVEKHKVGGLVFFKGTPFKQAEITNQLQKKADIPLLVGIDAEWGLSMRLDSTVSFPKNMTLGAITDNNLIYQMGAEMARQCKLLGIHINFAPSVDVNNNPENPVINTRSYGENQYNVAEKGIAFMRGMQDNGVLASAKHFPGHGDTNVDSHHELPIIPYEKERLDTLEIYPFKQLIDNGIASVMIGHLYISSIDTKDEVPASLSEKIIRSILKKELDFDGIVVTDALNMKAAKSNDGEHLAVSVIKAGNDILLMPSDVTGGIDAIEKAIENEELTAEQIEEKCRKVLTAKYRVGLNNYKPVDLKNLKKNLTTPETDVLINKLSEAAITLVANRENILPLKNLDARKIAYLEIGKGKGKVFEEQLDLYTDITKVSLNKGSSKEQLSTAKKQLDKYNTIIVGYHVTDSRASRNFGVDSVLIDFIGDLSKSDDKKIIFAYFGTPYFLSKVKLPQTIFDAIIVSYDNTTPAQNHTAQAIFGGALFKGKLPVSPSEEFAVGYGIETYEPIRLKYVMPQEVGFTASDIKKIDSLVNQGINQKAYPGCQVIAAYKGQVFYNKAFGRQTYDKNSPRVKVSDIYDVASVTKVSATLPLVMKMIDSEQLSLNKKLKDYVKLHPKSDKGNLAIRELLIHQAGLRAFIPFYMSMLTTTSGEDVFQNEKSAIYTTQVPGMKRFMHKNCVLDKDYFSGKKTDTYCYPVANSIYASNKTIDYVYSAIDTSKLQSKTYRYSDLGFIYLQRIIESSYKQKEDVLAEAFFYNPMGMNNTTYLPLDKKVAKTRIAPTEKDDIFRKQLVQGYVHDQAAAMLGGVAGHAGLFSNANDLAKLMQMYLNKGEYGGERYIDSSTIKNFTKYNNQTESRRGLGFDKPETRPKKASPVCKEASTASYGHSGFTGALVWVDPERDLVYIFLSNRIHPSTENSRISKLSTRTAILAQLLNTIDRIKVEENIPNVLKTFGL